MLICRASVVPHTVVQPHIEWLVNDTLKSIFDEDSVTLHFSELTLSDMGQYTCRATVRFETLGEIHTSEKTFLVNVEGICVPLRHNCMEH